MEQAEWKLLPAAINMIANQNKLRMEINMKVLVVGSGGREHAICWKISQKQQSF